MDCDQSGAPSGWGSTASMRVMSCSARSISVQIYHSFWHIQRFTIIAQAAINKIAIECQIKTGSRR
jgi:hypothetical protein